MKKWLTKIFNNYQLEEPIVSDNCVRERLTVLYGIETDKATYLVYNTQTTHYDAVNIEIEECRNQKFKIILEKEIFDDSWGALGGESFGRLVHNSKRHLKEYIQTRNESIIKETK